jgi:peptidoglycan/xylan/chitin deacetylase (PgdA/CDA1 family)
VRRRRRKIRLSALAWRAAALLAVLGAIATGATMAVNTESERVTRAIRNRLVPRHRIIVAHTPDGGAVPVATVIPRDEPPPWPPALLNPDARLRTAWDLSMGRPGSREVLFTFDDGPNPGTTDRLLGHLARARVKAVFFVCGWRLETDEPLRSRARAILRETLRQGHVIGNHTVRHRLLPTLTPPQLAHEIDHNADLIEEVIGQRPHLFRPPYGGYSEDVRRHLVGLRNELWLWSIDPHDYDLVGDSDRVAQRVIVGLGNHAGGTVLLHDTHAWSVNAVPKILQWIERENRDRAAQGRAPYVILDPAHYLQGARQRLPLIRDPEAIRAQRVRDAGVDARADVPEGSQGAVTQTAPDGGLVAPAPADAGRPRDAGRPLDAR